MKKNWYSLFTVLFLLLCTAPLLAMLFWGPSKAAANEVLSSRPVLFTRNGLNLNYLNDLSGYISDRFAFRQELVTANAALTAALFQESASGSVVLGEDGWLYYSDTLDDYMGASTMSGRDLFRAAHTLALAREYVESKGARFLFTIAPNKNSLYPEHMPPKYPAAQQPGNRERLALLLEEQGVPYCDLYAVLSRESAPVYYKTDSHWDGYGSALARDALVEALGGSGGLSSEDSTLENHRGDLYEMLYPAGTKLEQGRVLARERDFSYVGNFHAPDDLTIRTESGGDMGGLLMFRDSFGNLLHADLAGFFSNATFIRSAAPRLDLLDEEDTVIFEIVERNLPQLLTNPPVMPAPVREFAPPVGTFGAEIELSKRSCDEFPGLACYTGKLSTSEPLDWDSPIFISLGDTVYEANLTAPAGQDFTLYAPDAEELQVFVKSGGVWLRCE